MAKKYTPFKMKGHTLPGINQRNAGKLKDGRPGSSTFQYNKSESPMHNEKGEKKVKKKQTAEEKQKIQKWRNVTDEYKTKGSKATKRHIAAGGTVEMSADGSLRLVK